MQARQCWDAPAGYAASAQGEYCTSQGGVSWLEMAGRGGSNLMLVRNESSKDALVAMLASCAPVALQVQRGGGGWEDAGEEDPGDECEPNVEKKRRLTFDQVRSLERSFEVENKLEPERKTQLAKELGLQPRQVAVWFQNRRARWKTKQLERDYNLLTLDYNRLKSDLDAVIQENQELNAEIGKLQTPPQPNPVEGSHRSDSPSRENNAPGAEGGSGDTSADSISSEIVDADHHAMENLAYSAEAPGECGLLHVGDPLCNPMSVKLEEGSFQDESSCNYILTQLDDDRALPWWDWP